MTQTMAAEPKHYLLMRFPWIALCGSTDLDGTLSPYKVTCQECRELYGRQAHVYEAHR